MPIFTKDELEHLRNKSVDFATLELDNESTEHILALISAGVWTLCTLLADRGMREFKG